MTDYCDSVGDTCCTSHIYPHIDVYDAFYLVIHCFAFVFSAFIVFLCHSQPCDVPHHPSVPGYLKSTRNHAKSMKMTYYCDSVGDTCRPSHVYPIIHVSDAFYLLIHCFSFVFSCFLVFLSHSQPCDGLPRRSIPEHLKITQNHVKSLKITENHI